MQSVCCLRFFDELKDDCSMGEFGGAYELFIGFVLIVSECVCSE